MKIIDKTIKVPSLYRETEEQYNNCNKKKKKWKDINEISYFSLLGLLICIFCVSFQNHFNVSENTTLKVFFLMVSLVVLFLFFVSKKIEEYYKTKEKEQQQEKDFYYIINDLSIKNAYKDITCIDTTNDELLGFYYIEGDVIKCQKTKIPITKTWKQSVEETTLIITDNELFVEEKWKC